MKTRLKVEGDRFSRPRIEETIGGFGAAMNTESCGIFEKHGQHLDIVLIEKESSVFDLHLSQGCQEDPVAVCQKLILVELTRKMT